MTYQYHQGQDITLFTSTHEGVAPDLDVQLGDRIRLLSMGNDPCPVLAGSKGIVYGITRWYDGQTNLTMKWDSGRTLGLVAPPDRFEVIERPRAKFFEGDPT